jgi:hypothetical protein
MFFHLQRLGVDVGNRWEGPPDQVEARIGDRRSALAPPAWLTALIATERTVAARRMVEELRTFA